MKVTGTPTQEFISKLDSEDVSSEHATHTRTYRYAPRFWCSAPSCPQNLRVLEIGSTIGQNQWVHLEVHTHLTHKHTVLLWFIRICAALNVFILSFRPKATSKVSQKWKRKTFRMCFPQLIHKVGCAQPFNLISFQFDSQAVIWFPVSTLSSAVSVLERMLLLDPESRVTAAEALTLPYFSEFREPEEETEAQPYDHSLDNADLLLDQWKREDDGVGGDGGCNVRRLEGEGERRKTTWAVVLYWSALCFSL